MSNALCLPMTQIFVTNVAIPHRAPTFFAKQVVLINSVDYNLRNAYLMYTQVLPNNK